MVMRKRKKNEYLDEELKDLALSNDSCDSEL